MGCTVTLEACARAALQRRCSRVDTYLVWDALRALVGLASGVARIGDFARPFRHARAVRQQSDARARIFAETEQTPFGHGAEGRR